MKNIVISLILLIGLTGCYAQNKTDKSEQTVLFPIFAVNKSFDTHDNGQISHREEQGNMLLLASWTKACDYDPQGQRINRSENSVLFPLWATHEEENQTHIKKQGSILLLINYNVQDDK